MELLNVSTKKKEIIGIFSIDEVIDIVENDETVKRRKGFFRGYFEGTAFNLNAKIYDILKINKSISCPSCGLKAKYFRLEKDKREGKSYFTFRLYGEVPKGGLAVFTIDHILPKSKGGSNDLSNCRLMCKSCNMNKADGTPAVRDYISFQIYDKKYLQLSKSEQRFVRDLKPDIMLTELDLVKLITVGNDKKVRT